MSRRSCSCAAYQQRSPDPQKRHPTIGQLSEDLGCSRRAIAAARRANLRTQKRGKRIEPADWSSKDTLRSVVASRHVGQVVAPLGSCGGWLRFHQRARAGYPCDKGRRATTARIDSENRTRRIREISRLLRSWAFPRPHAYGQGHRALRDQSHWQSYECRNRFRYHDPRSPSGSVRRDCLLWSRVS